MLNENPPSNTPTPQNAPYTGPVKRNYVLKESKAFPWTNWQSFDSNNQQFGVRWQTGIHGSNSKAKSFNVILKNNTSLKLDITFTVNTDEKQYSYNVFNVQFRHIFDPLEEYLIYLQGNPKNLQIDSVNQVA